MPNIFKKISRGANKFFNKVGHDTNNVFTKTIPDVARKPGGAFEEFGDKTLDAMKKTGNFSKRMVVLLVMVWGLLLWLAE